MRPGSEGWRLQEVTLPGRKSPHNHAQTARNLRRSLRNAATGTRLIQAEGLDGKVGCRYLSLTCRRPGRAPPAPAWIDASDAIRGRSEEPSSWLARLEGRVERRSLVLAVCWDRDSWNDSAMVGDEARVVQAFCVWLAEHGWHTQLEVEHVDVLADRGNQRLYAEAKGGTAALGFDMDTRAGSSSGECRRTKSGGPCSPSLCRTPR